MESRLSTSKSFSFLFLVFLMFNCFTKFRSDAQLLPEEEVQTLQTISTKLQNTYWNISRTSCSQSQGLNNTIDPDKILSNVTCDCSFNNSTVCHVTSISLKRLNLAGVLPAEFGNLTHLREIDLVLNYISGSIPTSLTRLPLVKLSLLGNRISGTIPKEIGDIATLEELVLEDNLLGGPLPENLGKLSNLRRLLLSANNFTGSIPETFGNLKNLTDFMIDGSSLSGKIPDFIGSWTKLTRLDMQGTSMEGPIPFNVSQLKNLIQLRISDLNGSSTSDFPDLQDMKNLQYLVLRKCLITGSIPEYIGVFTILNTLDLSFNRLTGQIPATIRNLIKLNFLFLTNNSLNGEVPRWILDSKEKFDVSYNNFNGSPPVGCSQLDELSFKSFIFGEQIISSLHISTPACFTYPQHLRNLNEQLNQKFHLYRIAWCLRKDLPCQGKPQYHSLFINCGGSEMNFEGNEYDDDSVAAGASTFHSHVTNWAYSSTGVYMDNDKANHIASNAFSLNVTGIYTTARLAPISLKYYGLCLRKGSYRVQLHFAEIMYSDDQTYSSLGRRIFDVSIQGNVVLKDFNIMEEAKGVGKGITMNFPNVSVTGSTLEIHLYWSGKGTTAIPDRGVYGPLISAITVTPNFDVVTGLSVGAIVGIVAGSCVVLALILVVLRKKGFLGGKNLEDKELRGLDLHTGYFTLRQIKAATSNFDPVNKIGEGGFGPVYKGVLSDGVIIAVKQLSSKSKQGNREFVNEIGMISALQHPNLVKLYGCCIEGNQLLLIYEYLENNSLARALFGCEEQRLNLDWSTRNKICLGIARGLAYLHEESRLKIVHRDIKATNVLLDKDLNAKISDFGLAKLDEEENTHISTRIAGTFGYMAPEYAMWGRLTDKADVYSFGIVALEIVCGRSNIFSSTNKPKDDIFNLLDWASVLKEKGTLMELVDPRLGSDFNKEEVMVMINVALLCTNVSPLIRPTMSSVVSMLEGRGVVQEFVSDPSATNDEMELKAMRSKNQHSQDHNTSESLVQSMSIDSQCPTASTSAPDLYPINLDSTYWENRD